MLIQAINALFRVRVVLSFFAAIKENEWKSSTKSCFSRIVNLGRD